jgi:hypothetical protein
MLQDLQSWWQNLTPQMRAYILDGVLAFGALLGGHWHGVMVARLLRGWRFNALFRVTRQVPGRSDDDHGITPTMLAGLLVRLTVWAFAAWWLLPKYGRPEIAEPIPRIIGRVWTVAAALTIVLAPAGWLARRVIEFLEGVTPANRVAAAPSRSVAAAPSRSVAGAVGAGIYALVLLLLLLTAADYFDWPQTRNVVARLWQLALHLLTAGAAVLVGYVGVLWARESAAHGASGSEPAQQTGVGIVAVTTAVAVALVLFGGGLGLGIALLGSAAALLFLARGRLPDVVAGLKLRREKVGTVWFEGIPWQVGQIGVLNSQVIRNGEFFKVPNRQVLEACASAQSAHETTGRHALMR